jgi:hypothetical protein
MIFTTVLQWSIFHCDLDDQNLLLATVHIWTTEVIPYNALNSEFAKSVEVKCFFFSILLDGDILQLIASRETERKLFTRLCHITRINLARRVMICPKYTNCKISFV